MGDEDRLERKEKVRLISDILAVYLNVTEPDGRDKYWYGTVFDNLYDKGLVELYVTLEVYKRSKDKTHI